MEKARNKTVGIQSYFLCKRMENNYIYIYICIFYICINKQRKGKTIKVTHGSEEEWYGMGASQGWSETS